MFEFFSDIKYKTSKKCLKIIGFYTQNSAKKDAVGNTKTYFIANANLN